LRITAVRNPGRSWRAGHNDDWRLISFSSVFGCDRRELREIAADNVVGGGASAC